MRVVTLFLLLILGLFAKDLYYYQNHKKVVLSPVFEERGFNRSMASVAYFNTTQGHTVGVRNEVIVKLKPGFLIDTLKEYGSFKIKKNLSKRLYVLQTDSPKEAIALANALYKDHRVVYAHPNMIRRMLKR